VNRPHISTDGQVKGIGGRPRRRSKATERMGRRLSASGAVLLAHLIVLPALAGYAVAPRISVESETVTLADIVPGAPIEWAKVRLGRGPGPAREVTLSRAWILQKARQVGAQDQIEVPAEVVLARPGQEVDRGRFSNAVEEALTPRLAPGEMVRVVSVGLPGPVPTGPLDLKVRLPEGAIPSPTTLWVDVSSGGERKGQGWARVEIFRSRPALTATRSLRRGETLTAEDVEIRPGDAPWGTLSDATAAVGKVAARNLRAGAPVGARDLQTPALVQRGEVVRMVSRVGGVTATTLGKALDRAGLGEALPVENLASGRTVTGVLRDGGVVEVTSGLGR